MNCWAIFPPSRPIFADVNVDSGCLTAETIEPLISKNTKAISLVHLGGWPADMESIMDLSRHYKIPVIEDCSQAHGAKIKDRSVGSFGLISTWSFCQDKIISTGGEGGMVTSNSLKMIKKIKALSAHGIKSSAFERKKKKISWYRNATYVGRNFRMPDPLAALGISQLKKINIMNKKRNIIAKIYEKFFLGIKEIILQKTNNNYYHVNRN